jgi:glutathione S-transferase
MPAFTLVIGNKNYSSWSLRAWLATRQAGIPFAEVLLHLAAPDFRDQALAHSAAARVPVLKHDNLTVWDSLAIIEYLAELRPEAGLWPAEPAARAIARSISAEMHSSFGALRSRMPMNLRKDLRGKGRGPGVAEDVARIAAIWRECRSRHAAGGPFLFGAWSAADAMYTPVASRLRTYGVPLDAGCQAYADAVLAWPAFKEWEAAALAEPWIVPEDEIE